MKVFRFLLAICLLMFACAASAQNISVASFRLDESDMTAMQQGTSVEDQNGERCALIRVETSEDGFLFDVGSLGVVKKERRGGEIWLYVPHGVRRMTISHQQLGVLRDYSVPVSIQKGRTYIMKLTTGQVITTVEEAVTSQYLLFQVSPSDAIVELQGNPLILTDGTATKYLSFGTYDYNVSANMYHPTAGKVTINDPVNKHIVKVDLLPAFGYIEIASNATLAGAIVYVDGKQIGNAPIKTDKLASGSHEVKILRSNYKQYVETVTVLDNQTTTISPILSADFANITLSVENNAEVWVNGEKKGNGTWSGILGSGEYIFEAKLESHRPTKMTRTITASEEPVSITLQSPVPIYGSLDINSAPAMAEIFIDDKKVGETPMVVKNVLIGQHKIRLSKKEYSDETTTVAVVENQTENVNVTMKKGVQHTLAMQNGNSAQNQINIPNDEIWYTAIKKLPETTSTYVSGLYKNAFNTSISSHTFCDGKGMIKFNGNVTSVGCKAFSNCSGLTSITIPNSVTSIGRSAFENCSGLTSIIIPESVTSIGDYAFNGCSGLTSITIPNSVTSIGEWAFSACPGLTSIVVKSGNNFYDSRENCDAIIEKSTNTLIAGCKNTIIPNSVTSIGDKAFLKCLGLTSVKMPNSVTSIGDNAFQYCSGLKSIRIPGSMTSIGEGAFYGCKNLKTVRLQNPRAKVGKDAFKNCHPDLKIIKWK